MNKQKLREEFLKVSEEERGLLDDIGSYERFIADWWLSKFREYHKQLLEEDIKWAEKEIESWRGNGAFTNIAGGAMSALQSLIDSKREALNKLKAN